MISFMSSTAGRAARVIAGIVLIVVGLAVVGGTGGIIVAIVGLVPVFAGAGNVCLLGTDVHGAPR